MEVGAVKQAFNNEVILLKKCLNQAKIQTIHKLTRKAKTLAEKKGPEKLKEKFKRKAESAVKEVLIMKKIKPRDIARFIVTHKGELKDYLNKPQVDQDKACARLLIHKSLQNKYKVLRERFSNIRIEDLLMSRQERRKLKKEAREKQKKKQEKKNDKVGNSEGHWDVEDVEMGDNSILSNIDDEVSSDVAASDDDQDFANVDNGSLSHGSDGEELDDDGNGNVSHGSSDDSDGEHPSKYEILKKIQNDSENDGEYKDNEENKSQSNKGNEDDENVDLNVGKFVKATPSKASDKVPIVNSKIITLKNEKGVLNMVKSNKKSENKAKDSKKNKNFNDKILNRKFKKDTNDLPAAETKVVDPFFITATGENYMSVAEPRQPDEVKEIHKQGNRKHRRAVMFGHVPKIKPKQDNFRYNNNFNKQNSFEKKSGFNNKSRETNDRTGFKDQRFSSNNERSSNNDKKYNFNDRNTQFNKNRDEKPEKLHPSWEAKRKQSGILPFQGKKIVFGDT